MFRSGTRFGNWSPYGLAGFALCMLISAGCDQSKQDPKTSSGEAADLKTHAQQPAATAPPAGSATLQPPKPTGPPLNTVESLVAPVALYPDPLLAELLVASTYPIEIVEAARWLDSKPDLATLNGKSWDPSVQRLTEVPSVVKMMNDHLEWTTALGNAFLEDPEAVLGSVQTLRGKAVSSGFLKDTPQQKVDKKEVKVKVPEAAMEQPSGESSVQATPAVIRQEVIAIQPAKDDTLYVPQYNPEVAYSAPLAPAPGATTAYPATTAAYTSAAPAQTYYPTYAPTTTAATDSSTMNPWLTFGAGALVGGLVTWGIMELADNDDDRYYRGGDYGGGGYYGGYRVAHPYGDAVCYGGNCWNGGGYQGNGARGDVNIDRGDINVNREVNISGNQLSRDRTFKMNELQRTNQVWQHDPEHRRGQRYTAKAKARIGDVRQPDLAGQRLSGLKGASNDDRGIGGDRKLGEGLTKPSTLPAKKPLSADEIRGRLSGKKPELARPGSAGDLKAQRDQASGKLAEARQEGAFAGAKERGGQVRQEVQRGKQSRQIAGGSANVKERAAHSGSAPVADKIKQRPMPSREAVAQQRGDKLQDMRPSVTRPPTRPELKQRAGTGNAGAQQRIEQARRRETAKPAVFDGARDGSRAKNFGQRGAASREGMRAQRAAHPDTGRARAGGGGGFSRGDGGHARGGGGGGFRRR